ncbi:MAG: biotin-dependent carboxyltransferase [Thermoplasmata archaeon]|nr:biotin-dependent carboxyltransferase [Thermoplasmata archaeon]
MGVDLVFRDGGYFTTIQDLGRWGNQSLGFCISGAMDQFALKIANLLVGNDLGEACIEMTFKGAEIQFKGEALIALTGADMSPTINNEPIKQWQTIKVNSGDILKLKNVITGFRTYLSVKGGFDVPIVLGSKSSTPREKIGVFGGRAIRKGDIIRANYNLVNKVELKYFQLKKEYIPKYYDDNIKKIRVIDGPHSECFTKRGIETFYNSLFSVTIENDRTGYRLEGPTIEHKVDAGRLISGAITTGAIQVPGSGKPIILTAEHRTHGGYPIIATVATVDLSVIGQSKAGDKIKFELIDLKEAISLLKKESEFFKNFCVYVDDFNLKLLNVHNYYESNLFKEMEV